MIRPNVLHFGKESGFLGLFAKTSEHPVSILSGDRVIVLNEDLWKYVAKEYKADRCILGRKYHFGFFERNFSFDKLKRSVDVVASFDNYGVEADLKTALSRLVTMVFGSCFWVGVSDFVEYVICAREEDNVEMGEDLVELLRDWRKVSKNVYEGRKVFLIGGVERNILELRGMLSLMESRKEEREVVLFEPRFLEEAMWCDIASLKPGLKCFKMVVKVISNDIIFNKGEARSQISLKLSHCVIADASASITFCARNEQLDLLVPGSTVLLMNAEVEMFMGRMFVVVGKGGDIIDNHQTTIDFVVNQTHNLSDDIYP